MTAFANRLAVLIFILGQQSWAAVPQPQFRWSAKQEKFEAIKRTLKVEDLDERVEKLKKMGEGTADLIKELYKSERESMPMRWRALTAYARLGGVNALTDLTAAISDKEWYIRNAALISLARLEPEQGRLLARKLLSDPAMIVRMSAVDVLFELRDLGAKKLLWQKLDHPTSFRGKQSLAIRSKIMEALSGMEIKGSEKNFVEVLSDNDEKLHRPAIKALERITQQQLGTPGDALASKRSQWQQWWMAQKASSKLVQ